MSSLSPSRSRPAGHIIGVLPRPRRQHWLMRPMLHYTRVAAAALLGATVGLAMLAGAMHSRPPRTRPVVRTLTVKRPLPEDMSERDVVKWVPLRQPSGRTEFAPWTSTDAELVHDPEVLKRLLVPAPAEPSASDKDLARLEQEAKDAAAKAAAAKQAKPSPPLLAPHAVAANRATGSLLPMPSPSSTPVHGSPTTRGTAAKAQGADPIDRRPSLATPPSTRTGSPLIAAAPKPAATNTTSSQPISPHPQPAGKAARPHDDAEPHARPQ